MATVRGDQVPIQGGSDARSHTTNLQQNVADQLSVATGAAITPADVIPPATQDPVVDGLMGELEIETDWEDFVAGEKGRPRTEPSKNFLATLWQRLKKKNPESDIKSE